jgi:hypothetical protein
LAARNISSSSFYYDTTNSAGEFSFDNLNCGEYNIATGAGYEDLIQELYKGVCLLDPNQFEEGDDWSEIYSSAANIFIYPGENLSGIDIGLSSYKYTFGAGLNLFGYPGLPVEKYDHTNEFCLRLGSAMKNFRGKDPDSGAWYVVTTSNLNINPKQIHRGQGYIIYMNNKAGPIFFPPFKTIPPESYHLKPGKNFISYPSSLHSPIKRSSELLAAFGTQEEVASIKSFDNTSGKWSSTVWLWNKPGAADFPIVQGAGYVAEMRVTKEIETDEPNI